LIKLLQVTRIKKALTVSIIIPVYNEEDYLGLCLDSIAQQSVKPFEVIVVDNNSTDASVDIAKGYPFVTVISEKRQHQAFAQYKGFCAAKGDIIGRIDADTILPEDWVERITIGFQSNAHTLAFTVWGNPYDVVMRRFGKIIHQTYNKLAYMIAGQILMWGSSCAFRRSGWDLVQSEVFLRGDIWEDFDLAFCLYKHGEIAVLPGLEVNVSFREVHRPVLHQMQYHIRAIRTFKMRKGPARAIIFAMIWSSILLIAPIIAIDRFILEPMKAAPLFRFLTSKV
jgi:glycosyltransferase involved in cell wall biosynthesis